LTVSDSARAEIESARVSAVTAKPRIANIPIRIAQSSSQYLNRMAPWMPKAGK
jgi:hypothetical protein